jgi:hypothetical protein
VLGFGFAYWASLRSWASDRRLLVGDEETLLRVASGVTGGFPTEWQSARLLALKDRMEGEGYPRPKAA